MSRNDRLPLCSSRSADPHPPTTYGEPMSSSMVDWDLAVATGTRLVRPARRHPGEAREAVAELRELRRRGARPRARRSPGWTRRPTAPRWPSSTGPAGSRPTPPGFRTVLEPLVEKLQERRPRTASPCRTPSGSRVTGVQTGSLLAFLATKVLGQYELFPPYGEDPGDSRAGCCSSRRTSSPPSASWTSTRATSGSGCACTRRPTGCSSARCRGCARTSWPRSAPSSARPTSTRQRSPRGSRRPRRRRTAPSRTGSTRTTPRAARSSRPCRPRSSARSSTGSPR